MIGAIVFFFGLTALAASIWVFITANGALHEIESFILLLIAVTLFSATGIIDRLDRILSKLNDKT